MGTFTLLDLPFYQDERGVLTVADGLLPFRVERVYWINGAQGQMRGGHRHKVTTQGLIAIAGTIEVYMDDGRTCGNIVLNDPHKCLIVEPKDWHTMLFCGGSILLALASHPYNRDDYIDEPYTNGV